MLNFFKRMASARLTRRLEIALGELKEFNMIHDTFIWDVICFFRKQGRFIVRMFQWIPILYNDEDWDFNYFLYIVRFKLTKIKKCLSEDDMHVNANRRAREVGVVIAHLDRYFDIGKYTIDVDTDEYLNNSSWLSTERLDGSVRHSYKDSQMAKRHRRIHDRQNYLTEFHFSEAMRKLKLYGRAWWV